MSVTLGVVDRVGIAVSVDECGHLIERSLARRAPLRTHLALIIGRERHERIMPALA